MKLSTTLSKTLKPALEALPNRSKRTPTMQRRDLARVLVTGERLDEELIARLDKQLILPAADQSDEETSRAAVQDHGQYLVRQDRWDELSDLIREADTSRRSTPCAMSHAELLCYGARADVVQAGEDAILDGANPSLEGIEALEEALMEEPGDYARAVIVAQTHIDFAWAWRGGDWPHEIPERNLALFEAHIDRAADILAAFNNQSPKGPLLPSARCALLAGRPLPVGKLADEYEALIALDPTNPRPMRALGHHLLPRWHGSYDRLELEARRIASLSSETWGNGGYTWVFWDAIAIDPGAARVIDLDFFIDGMRDILARTPVQVSGQSEPQSAAQNPALANQYYANQMAAYAAITMDPNLLPQTAPDLTHDSRARLHETLDWILSDYLCELHPLVWAQAALGHDPSAPLPMRKTLVRRGMLTAKRTIARHFADEIRSGKTIAFSPHGLRLYEPQP
ncbi:hypothetical protein N4R57_08115 [Rhodobacteraceae bacterium D3-12]|nr:hypothetical protein N4R57_08115 [Rhodobacteraceae bacterium D3-12]